jgi:hypothetical protein
MTLVPRSEKEYFSADSISNCTDTCNDVAILYPIEYRNSLTANNFPTHKFESKAWFMQWHMINSYKSWTKCYRGCYNYRHTYMRENIYT